MGSEMCIRDRFKVKDDGSWDDLQEVLAALVSDQLSTSQQDAINDMKRAFHM